MSTYLLVEIEVENVHKHKGKRDKGQGTVAWKMFGRFIKPQYKTLYVITFASQSKLHLTNKTT